MAIEIKWYGHATWQIKTGEHSIILDPFFTENPSCNTSVGDIESDFILVSHGHFDHIADCAALANRTAAKVVAIYEIAQWLSEKHSVVEPLGMNIGGSVELDFGIVKMTPAIHSSQLPDGSYGGEPAGFVITIGNQKIYFACDTALFSDMSIIGKMGIDVAVLPMGDLFTMGPTDSVEATKLVNPKMVVPTHYNTWPPIEQDTDDWASQIRQNTNAEPVVLKPGASFRV